MAGEENLTQIIESAAQLALSNPYTLIAMAIQFLLGFGLGYVAGKAFKYVIAFIAILVLGIALNVWSLGYSLEDLVRVLGEKGGELKTALEGLLQAMGLLSLGPASLGFVLGAVTAFLRK